MEERQPLIDHDTGGLYQQLPLGYSGDSIRILQILPGLWYHKIRVALKVISLSSELRFEALSYTWGGSSAGRKIIVNDAYHLPVTDNLFNALRRLRPLFSSRLLWVDKVCINQDDSDEKSRQVVMMADIYQRASCVNVWLGEPGPTCPFTLKVAMPKTSERRFWDAGRWWIWLEGVRNRPRMIDNAIAATSPRWQDRAWTVQEFVVGRDVYLCFGSVRRLLEWGWLDLLVHDTICTARSFQTDFPAFSGLRSRVQYELLVLRYELHSSGDSDYQGFLARNNQLGYDREFFGILDLRNRLHPGGAKDLKDQVFSLLGLINSPEATSIGVDYTLSNPQVFAKATYASIVNRGNFDIFALVLPERQINGLPSWCLDFSRCTRRLGFTRSIPRTLKSRVRTTTGNVVGLETDLDASYTRITLPAVTVDKVVARVTLPGGERSSTLTSNVIDEIRGLLRQANERISAHSDNGVRYDQSRIFDLFSKCDQNDLPADAATCVENLFEDKKVTRLMLVVLGVVVHRIFDTWTRSTGLQALFPNERCHMSAAYSRAIGFVAESYNGRVSVDSSVFITSTGLIGLAPTTVALDDMIVQVRSYDPFVALRPAGALHTFQGQVLLHGLWGDGCLEAFESLELPQQKFTLC